MLNISSDVGSTPTWAPLTKKEKMFNKSIDSIQATLAKAYFDLTELAESHKKNSDKFAEDASNLLTLSNTAQREAQRALTLADSISAHII
jgi:hypothetical protein